ncbi:MAG: hypothetical protein WDA24_10600 [Tissierellales bacterium]
MNILGYTDPSDLLEALNDGDIDLQDFYEEIGDEKVFAKELENEYCEPCKANQCNYCSVYVIQTKYLD